MIFLMLICDCKDKRVNPYRKYSLKVIMGGKQWKNKKAILFKIN